MWMWFDSQDAFRCFGDDGRPSSRGAGGCNAGQWESPQLLGDPGLVPVLLKTAGKDGADVEKDLRRLRPLKTEAEYDPDDFPVSAASLAVARAERCVAVARRVVASLR
jgi:hypothetical protein